MSGEGAEIWEGNINVAVVERWKEDTTTFERVREVLIHTSEFKSISSIAENAHVSSPTAGKHLKVLHNSGMAEMKETADGMVFRRSKQQIALQRIAEIHNSHSIDEVMEAIQRLKARKIEYQEEYGVDSVEELAISAEGDEEGVWNAISEWRTLEQDLDVAMAALSLYEFDPHSGSSGEATSEEDSPMRFGDEGDSGAFAS